MIKNKLELLGLNMLEVIENSKRVQRHYKRKQGEIKGDTIVFYENFYNPFYKEIREERYVLSDMSFE